MNNFFIIAKVLCFFLTIILINGCGQQKRFIAYEEVVSHLTNNSYIAKIDLPSTIFFSSYDRTGGNNDYGFYLRDLEPGWGVIAEAKGPGYVSRLWFTGEATNQRIRIYIDKQSKPALELTIKEFCGIIEPFTPPLAAYENYCYYNYVPIPFAKHIVIAIEKGTIKPDGPPKHYYQVNIEPLSSICLLESFRFPFSEDNLKILDAVRRRWSRYKLGKEMDMTNGITGNFTEKKVIAAGTKMVITNISGPALIKRINLICDENSAENFYEPWRSVLLNIYWDERELPSVSVPIGDFFGIVWRKIPASSIFFNNSGTILQNEFPMPFSKSAKIELINQGNTDFAFSLIPEIDRDFTATNSIGYFHCVWHSSGGGGAIGSPHTVLQVKGEGRYAGCILSAVSLDKSFWLLEGDEIMAKDDEPTPFWRGTGLEDYFNGGWYYQNIKARPLHGLLNKTFFRTVQYRFHLPEAITFKKSFNISFERGPEHKSRGYFESTAFCYLKEPQGILLSVTDFPNRLPPTDDLEEANIMVELLNSERAGDYEGAIKQIEHFTAKYPQFPYNEMLLLRKTAYLEKLKGFNEARKLYEQYALSTNNDIRSQAETLLWFNEDEHNAIASLNANTPARLWLDGKLVMEANTPQRLFIEKIKLNSGKHTLAIQFKHRTYPFWIQGCLKTHKGLFFTDTTWRQCANPKGNWGDIAYDDSNWSVIGGTGSKGPPEEPFIWLEPNAFIEMQALPVAIWSTLDWDDPKTIMVVRKVFEVP